MLLELPLGCNNVPCETCELQIAGEKGRHYIEQRKKGRWKKSGWREICGRRGKKEEVEEITCRSGEMNVKRKFNGKTYEG